MPIIRKKLIASDVYPDDIRYNTGTDTVQSLIDGEWVDNPAADPRNQTTFPPRITSATACDAAQSVVDALKGQIDGILAAIDNGQTAAQIAGLILGLLSFGVFAIFINIALAIANAMLDAGTVTLAAALTSTVYEQLNCILYCHMDNQGRLQPGGFEAVQGDVDGQIGGLAATIINQMLSLAGEGGINNLASLGTSTGDCSGCTDCECLHDFDVQVGSFIEIGNDGSGHYIQLSSEYVVHNGLAAHWAVVGGGGFCCVYQGFIVTSGAISSGGVANCSGGGGGIGSPAGNVEFYHTTTIFTIKYYFS